MVDNRQAILRLKAGSHCLSEIVSRLLTKICTAQVKILLLWRLMVELCAPPTSCADGSFSIPVSFDINAFGPVSIERSICSYAADDILFCFAKGFTDKRSLNDLGK